MSTKKQQSLEQLQLAIEQFCSERNWDQFHNLKDLAISLNLEASEVLEHFQWKNDEEMKKHGTEKKSEVGEELADILYWILLITNKLDIDITDAFMKKLEKNRQKYPIEKAKGNHKKYTELSD